MKNIEIQKESMLKINEAFIIINLLLSFAILGGILNIIGALFATERTFKHGRKFSLPLLPVLHALTIGNAYFLAFGSDVEITNDCWNGHDFGGHRNLHLRNARRFHV